jgi:tetratricopeptide (TPR) repeat protein
VSHDIEHWKAHFQLGWAYAHHGDVHRAAESFGQAVALQPYSAEALRGRGWTLGELGHRDLAVAAFRRALALKPDVAVFHADLGVNLDLLGQQAEAAAALREDPIRTDPAPVSRLIPISAASSSGRRGSKRHWTSLRRYVASMRKMRMPRRGLAPSAGSRGTPRRSRCPLTITSSFWAGAPIALRTVSGSNSVNCNRANQAASLMEPENRRLSAESTLRKVSNPVPVPSSSK